MRETRYVCIIDSSFGHVTVTERPRDYLLAHISNAGIDCVTPPPFLRIDCPISAIYRVMVFYLFCTQKYSLEYTREYTPKYTRVLPQMEPFTPARSILIQLTFSCPKGTRKNKNLILPYAQISGVFLGAK